MAKGATLAVAAKTTAIAVTIPAAGNTTAAILGKIAFDMSLIEAGYEGMRKRFWPTPEQRLEQLELEDAQAPSLSEQMRLWRENNG